MPQRGLLVGGDLVGEGWVMVSDRTAGRCFEVEGLSAEVVGRWGGRA